MLGKDLEREKCVYEFHLDIIAGCFLKSSCNIAGVLRSYRMGQFVTKAQKINDGDSFELCREELPAFSRSDVPLGTGSAICQNVTNDLIGVNWKDVDIRKFIFFSGYNSPYM